MALRMFCTDSVYGGEGWRKGLKQGPLLEVGLMRGAKYRIGDHALGAILGQRECAS